MIKKHIASDTWKQSGNDIKTKNGRLEITNSAFVKQQIKNFIEKTG